MTIKRVSHNVFRLIVVSGHLKMEVERGTLMKNTHGHGGWRVAKAERGDDVLDVLLDGAAQVARAVGLAVALTDEVVDDGGRPVQGHAALGHGSAHFVEHEGGDGAEVFLREVVKVDDLVDAVEKLRTQELIEGALRALAALIVRAQAEAERAGARVAAGVRGHDDDRVFKIHGAALRVRDAAVVEDLQQQVHDVRVRLFDLVEEDDGVRAAADLLRELAGLVIADVARGRADHARDGKLLHILRHIQPDERLGRVEELVGEALDQLRLADAGATDEQKAHGLALGLQADAVAPDGGADGVDGMLTVTGRKGGAVVPIVITRPLILIIAGQRSRSLLSWRKVNVSLPVNILK